MGKAKHPHDAKRPEPQAVLRAIEKNDLEALLNLLSVRQKRFAEEYVYDYNGSAAAVRAGYALNHSDKQAWNLLRHKGVAYYVDHLTRRKESNITVVDENWIVQKIIKTIETAEDLTNLTAALRGLELLARHKGMLTDKQEITGKDGGPIEVERRTQEEADSLVEQLRSLHKKKEVVLLDPR